MEKTSGISGYSLLFGKCLLRPMRARSKILQTVSAELEFLQDL